MDDEEVQEQLRMLGEKVKAARENAGLTKDELTERMNSISDEEVKDYVRAFGRNIHEARSHAGLSAEELAARVGISPTKMRSIEHGTSLCEVSLGIKTASVLEVDFRSLF